MPQLQARKQAQGMEPEACHAKFFLWFGVLLWCTLIMESLASPSAGATADGFEANELTNGTLMRIQRLLQHPPASATR